MTWYLACQGSLGGCFIPQNNTLVLAASAALVLRSWNQVIRGSAFCTCENFREDTRLDSRKWPDHTLNGN
jgi:hypothetical protein